MSKYVFGVDLGGTSVKMGLFDQEGNLLDKWEIPTVTENEGQHILPDIAASLQNKIEERDIALADVIGAGIGVPGPVDEEGRINQAANLNWHTCFSIPEGIQQHLNIPVVAGNDANVAALGEMWQGGGKGYSNLFMVTLGTGVGGGIIVGGRIITGATGAAGEIGHICVEDRETKQCGCRNVGCLEQYASATGIVSLARKRLDQDQTASVLRQGELSAKSVFDAVKAGDPVAEEIAQEFGRYLGKGLAAISCVVNPQAFVIGGGVSKAGEILFRYIKPNYEKHVFHACRDVVFALATLGNDAGIYGAAKMVLDKVK
ncbi:MAG: ROK family glucokinase [Lachnospiraceae bacterium]|nr:ROK family glucokinase [Lachnospiraceae bacterium]